jgi:predicted small integral membrane protein
MSEIDTADEFVVDIHLLRFDTILPDFFFMYHDLLDQFIENMGR